jgi:hypothetical protein
MCSAPGDPGCESSEDREHIPQKNQSKKENQLNNILFKFNALAWSHRVSLMVVLKKAKGTSKKVDHSIFTCNMVV